MVQPIDTRGDEDVGRTGPGAQSSKDLADYRFRIEGHTDTVGSADYNQALSERRAKAVVSYMAKKYGVNTARLEPVGKVNRACWWPRAAADAGAAQPPRPGHQHRHLRPSRRRANV